jgi:hypothetical protein
MHNRERYIEGCNRSLVAGSKSDFKVIIDDDDP